MTPRCEEGLRLGGIWGEDDDRLKKWDDFVSLNKRGGEIQNFKHLMQLGQMVKGHIWILKNTGGVE